MSDFGANFTLLSELNEVGMITKEYKLHYFEQILNRKLFTSF